MGKNLLRRWMFWVTVLLIAIIIYVVLLIALSKPSVTQPSTMILQAIAVSPTPWDGVTTPLGAASLASEKIGRTDVSSVETTNFIGVDVYAVTFSSGDIVYVDFDGQVLP